jgi:hypothetical protein
VADIAVAATSGTSYSAIRYLLAASWQANSNVAPMTSTMPSAGRLSSAGALAGTAGLATGLSAATSVIIISKGKCRRAWHM